jgi:hypothetical protein
MNGGSTLTADDSNNNTAAAKIRPPKALIIGEDGANAWKLWEQQFDWFLISTQLDTKPGKVQAATLLATIGPDVIPIFNSWINRARAGRRGSDPKKIYEPFCAMTYERYLFNKIVAEPGNF